MKNLIAVLGLILTPFLVSANFSLDDGKYFNHSLRKKVSVNCTNHSIKVRGLVNHDWTRFRSIGRREFVDRRGNSIRIIGHNAFEFRARNRNRVVIFQRNLRGGGFNNQAFGCNSRCDANCTIHGGQNHGGFNNGYNDGYNDYPNNGYADSSGFEGVWTSTRFESDVIIERTNEGLRAKLIGSNREWTYYRQDSYDRKEYFDNRGNRYVARSGRELVWYSKQGGAPIVLRKLR